MGSTASIQKQNSSIDFIGCWALNSGKRAARDGAGYLADKHLTMPAQIANKLDRFERASQPLTQKAVSYKQITGIDNNIIDVPLNQTLDVFKKAEGRAAFKTALKSNFESIHAPKVNPFKYPVDGVIARNLKEVTSRIAEDRQFLALTKCLGLGLAGLPVILDSINTFKKTHSLEATANTFGKSAIRSLFSWELGTIGFMVGYALFPVGLLATVSGILAMGFTSTLTFKLFNKLFGNP